MRLLEFITDAGNFSFVDGATGHIVLGAGDDLSIDTGASGGAIDIAPRIIGTDGTGDSVIRLDAGTGTLRLDNTTGDLIATDIGNVTLIGSTITLSNDIISDTGNIDIDGAVVLENDNGTITVSTLTGSGGTIDFDSTINATNASTDKENLTIVSGSGTVNVGGIIGGSTAIKDLTISTGDTDTGAVTLNGIGSAADSVGAAAVAIGSNAVGGKSLASITFDGDFYTTSGTQTYTADSYPINGTDTAFTATNSTITFNDAGAGTLLLSNSTNLKIDTGSTAIGNISIGREITNTAGDATNAVDVELIAGTGSVSVSTISGYINDVAISAGHADGITLNGNITTAKILVIPYHPVEQV